MMVQASFSAERISNRGFTATIDALVREIDAAGMTIFFRIDHAAAAAAAGLSMPPTTVIFYGNARGGTPVMLAAPRAALDLPLRVLVREEGEGRVIVAFHPVAEILERAGVSAALAAGLSHAQLALMDRIEA